MKQQADNENKMNPQTILGLKISNIKRIRVANIQPNGKHVVLTGDNDQGKSSALDALTSAFSGGKSIPEMFLRKGTKKGYVDVDMEDLSIRLSVTEKNTTLTVKRKPGGEKVSRPQTLLNEFFSALTFDPISFDRMNNAQQVEIVRKLAGIDLTAIDLEIANCEQARLEIGRAGKALQDELKVSKTYDDVPEVQVSMTDLTAKLATENRKTEDRNRQKHRCESFRQQLNASKDKANNIEIEIKTLEAQIAQLKEDLKTNQSEQNTFAANVVEAEKLFESMAPGNPEAVTEEINSSEEVNRKVRHNLSLVGKRADYKRKIEAYQEADEALKAKRAKKTEILAQSKLPINGLEFSDAGVTMDGIPFSQIGAASRLKISTQIGIAMNPKLKVMLVRDASLMDQNTLDQLMAIANKEKIQVWLEQVDENAPDGADVVVFEDGVVKFEGDTKAETVDPSPNAAPFNEPDVKASSDMDGAIFKAASKVIEPDEPTERMSMEELQKKAMDMKSLAQEVTTEEEPASGFFDDDEPEADDMGDPSEEF